MTKDYAAITRDISAYTAEMRQLVPQTMQAFPACRNRRAPMARSMPRPRR